MWMLHTDETGLWSWEAKKVVVTSLELSYLNEERNFGELRVYFDVSTWNIRKNGLIYTNELFIKELKKVLCHLGLDSTILWYSEQGMQGDNYVSFDVEKEFIDSWIKQGRKIPK